MKNIFLKTIGTVTLSLCLCASTLSIHAQSTNSTNAVSPPSVAAGLTQIYNALSTSGLATATNYAVEPYLTYAPSAPTGNQIGGGAFLCYNVSTFIGTGLGVDYLGQFSLVSAQVQLKVPTHPFTFIGGSWTNVAFVPFALAGVGTPLNGTGNGAIAVTDAGAYVGFGHLWGGQFNTGVALGKWNGAPTGYAGTRYHFFLGWLKGF